MNHRPSVPASNSRIINGTALGFSILFLLASLAAACFVGEWGHVFLDWRRIMISPCPLVTDYLAIGGLSSAFLNAGACGLACFFFMVLLKGDSHANTLAGYFLVVAHCFYGLNFLNMWPCFSFTLIRKYLQQLITNADRQGHNKQAIRLGGLLLYIHKNRLCRM